jgi:2-polyprenyl-6-methoxyphenol hydroxylase-like FAD-dependent oxidoreductase
LVCLNAFLISTITYKKQFLISFSGGGIGGLILAHALSKYDHIHTSVFEASHQFAGNGTGIAIFDRGWTILRELGLGEAMERLCGKMVEDQDNPVRSKLQYILNP